MSDDTNRLLLVDSLQDPDLKRLEEIADTFDFFSAPGRVCEKLSQSTLTPPAACSTLPSRVEKSLPHLAAVASGSSAPWLATASSPPAVLRVPSLPPAGKLDNTIVRPGVLSGSYRDNSQ